ncbi:DUF2505 domain-containing protein [Nocardioides daeguensis]|uniref:DUF2505 domain-containing protein n=1 Tax=Nocardioides daeguensis TaxID=908359 RepID=A0ABP6VSI4_9ACTN|nr:DUF2505 domain-containing protein [Nocardioides daeguensis]MBV6728476.1 DUF2505 domain-containing protein [Nocardioides daeguensis]MCR1773900.1 DUF2505 domain-containing protein [Nocardioides daeguensis]
MATRLVHEMTYDAPAIEVAAMLSDPVFRETVCRNQRATSYTVEIEGNVDAKAVRIEMEQPTDKVPAFAKKFIGATTTIVQTETWASPLTATITVGIPGKPGEINGTATLVETDGVTKETVELEIKVKIPLVAGKIEELLAKLLGSALRAEERTGKEWLAS